MYTIPAELLAHMSLSDFARLTEAHLSVAEQREQAARAERAERPTEPAPRDTEQLGALDERPTWPARRTS